MKKRILALLLALVMGLSLAACSVPAAENSDQPSENPSDSAEPAASDKPAIEADLTQDILTFACAELAEADDVVVVNGEAVPTSRFCYWLALSCSYFESMYYYYGYTVADYASYIMSDACTMAAYYSLLEKKAAELGCPLTDEQLETINTEMEVGTETHTERQKLYGLSHEDLMFIYSAEDLYNNVKNVLFPNISEEDLNNYVYQVKHILIATAASAADGVVTLKTGKTVEYAGTAEEYNAEALAKAESILTEIRGAADTAARFDELMHEHSEDGRDENGDLAAPDGYTATPGQMVAEFEKTAFAIEIGEISDVVESDYGYHIILRGTVEDIESYSESYAAYKMDAAIDTWLSEADIVTGEVLKRVDVADFYARYVAWQSACIAANSDDGD